MSLFKRIDEDIIKALKSGDKHTTTTLRGLKSDIKYFKINNSIDELTDEDVVKVMTTAAKQRRDSIEKFNAGGRDDLVANESTELELIKQYLPAELTPEELDKLVMESLEETGASTPAEMGKVMKVIIPKVKGRADGKAVKDAVMKHLKS
ncbi:MAG: GatB/YqeY domain-containing protein [candidate division Zixibacteria bacterium]|nr:GatB/YqeY domain-containing protein [candidate division Zixibacteria bacterium]